MANRTAIVFGVTGIVGRAVAGQLRADGAWDVIGVSRNRPDDLPGIDKPNVSVAIDSGGRYYYGNQLVPEDQLPSLLRKSVVASTEPLTLIVHADRAVSTEMFVRLAMLARSAGFTNAVLATLPRPTPVRQSKATR